MSLAKVRLIELPCKTDERGHLTVMERETIPFAIARLFYIHGIPPGVERGYHAHRVTEQFIIAMAGSFSLDLTDGRQKQSYQLNSPDKGVYIPPMIWGRLHGFSPDAVCTVVASTHYSESDYIRDWTEFQRMAGVHQP